MIHRKRNEWQEVEREGPLVWGRRYSGHRAIGFHDYLVYESLFQRVFWCKKRPSCIQFFTSERMIENAKNTKKPSDMFSGSGH